ncbi:MAG: hypothetical protein R3B06_26065 [Kofleriaceae bacterium]
MTSSQPARGPSLLARVIGAALGGGLSYGVLIVTGAWGLGPPAALAIAAAMAVAGFAVGPAIVSAVAQLL